MNGSATPVHIPVLASRCIQVLAPAIESVPVPTAIDATLGLGGHTALLLQNFPDLRVIGIDRDPQALEVAGERLKEFGQRFQPVHVTYDEIAQVVEQHAPDGVHAILMDLGVSSMQLDQAQRGFSYSQDAPLDMRMDQSRGRSAAEFLQQESEDEIRRTLRVYGEEKFAARIAATIVARRQTDPVRTSADLVAVLDECIPAPARRTGGNPAKRSFQALRIAVNEELEILSNAIPAAVEALSVGGRIAVMSYQSLEDRIVKRAFSAGATSTAPPGFPVELPEHAPYLELITRGAEQASEEEIAQNPRSKPVRLRVAKKIKPVRRGGQ